MENQQRIQLILNKHSTVNSIPINPISHGQIVIEGRACQEILKTRDTPHNSCSALLIST